MARGGCRDCTRCTEPWGQWLLLEPFRFLFWFALGFWAWNMFRRGCPHCRHLLAMHQRRAGVFAD